MHCSEPQICVVKCNSASYRSGMEGIFAHSLHCSACFLKEEVPVHQVLATNRQTRTVSSQWKDWLIFDSICWGRADMLECSGYNVSRSQNPTFLSGLFSEIFSGKWSWCPLLCSHDCLHVSIIGFFTPYLIVCKIMEIRLSSSSSLENS